MWFRNVKEAILALFVWEGLLALLIQIDRVGNAMSGGNPKATISGRTGYYAMYMTNDYWRILQRVVNFTFAPIDGKDHCYRAYVFEKGLTHRTGNDAGLTLLSIVVLLACTVIIPVTYGIAGYTKFRIYLDN